MFPPKPKERKQYKQNESVISENKKKVLAKIKEIDTIRKWKELILSEIELRGQLNLSDVFFRILKEEKNSHIAVTVLFNLIKHIYSNPEKLQLTIEQSLETNDEFKNISLWKMSITKLQ